MNQQQPTSVAITLLALLVLLACVVALAQEKVPRPSAATDPSAEDLPPWNAPPTPRQIQALVVRVTENQHRDDLAIHQYERKERIISHRGKGVDASEWATEVVPAGPRLVRVELERNGRTADPDSLEQQWQQAIQALIRETNTDDPDVKRNDDREGHREHERYEMVDAVGRAFRFHWMGRVNQGGRAVLEFSFEPNPAYKSSALFAAVYAHIVGIVWVDEADIQVVRIDAKLKDDLSIVGGLIAKVYRGAEATLRQEEVGPGIWEPMNYSFDYEGRKFLFSTLSGHEQMDASDYLRLGSPEEALATLRREHPNAAASSR